MNILEARRRLLGADVEKKTAEGNPVSVRSLARMYPGIEMEGWTEQASTTGAQLFDIDDNELAPDNPAILRFKCHLVEGESYTITNNGNDNINFKISDRRDGYNSVGINRFTGSRTFLMYRNENIPESSEQFLHFWIYQGEQAVEVNDISMIKDLNIMINAGSEALPYEPYTGAQPSPSPDYPQEIVSAGKYDEGTGKWKYEVKLTGANLFDPNAEYVEGTYVGLPLHNKGKVSLILYEKNPDIDISAIFFGFTTTGYDSSEGFNWAIEAGEYSGGAIVNVVDDAYLSVYPKNKLDTVLEKYDVMVNYGTEPLPYQPYKEQTVTLTADRPLTKWDRLEKRNGQWGWVYKSGTMEFDGSEDENWLVFKENLNNIWFYLTINGKYSYYDVFCNKFRFIKKSVSTDDVEGIGNSGLNVSFSVGVLKNKLTSADVAGWKSWIQSNPFIIWYKTTEETFVPLTESEQSALNALHTNYPTTVLVNGQGCNMKLTYKTKKSLEVT